ncbi:MAG: hypothetical protein ACRERE_21955 [Candidatus Entotheonellia bacterium]
MEMLQTSQARKALQKPEVVVMTDATSSLLASIAYQKYGSLKP